MAISRMDMERQLRAGGGIMTLEEPRQGYFLGKIVKKAKRAVKKVVKSPLGKAALLAGIGFGIPGTSFGGLLGRASFGGAAKGIFGNVGGIGKLLGSQGKLSTLGDIFRVGGKAGAKFSVPRMLAGGLGATAIAAPFFMGGDEEEVEEETPYTSPQASVEEIRDQARAYYGDPTNSALYFMPRKELVRPFAEGGLASLDTPKRGMVDGPGSYAGEKPSFLDNFLSAIDQIKSGQITATGDKAREFVVKEGFGTNFDEDQIAQIIDMKNRGMDLDSIATIMEANPNEINELFSLLESKADGGIIGMRENFETGKLALGEGFKSKELNDMALEMFGKNLKLLNRDELEQLRDEYDIKKGRVEAAEGGLMDLGGLEKDYREGGFVPLGAEERADDVPARLSKNEFVFTADAVRNAGQGDIDKGAEVMQNMMDNLEAGGTISEESQGLENPAQAMFDQAQQLESRIE